MEYKQKKPLFTMKLGQGNNNLLHLPKIKHRVDSYYFFYKSKKSNKLFLTVAVQLIVLSRCL